MTRFKSHNLLGDGLNVYPALRAWRESNPDELIMLHCLPDYTAQMYYKMGLDPLVIVHEDIESDEPEFNFDVNQAFQIGHERRTHIAKAYAMMLGVDIGPIGSHETFKLRFDVQEEEHEEGLILLSIFSNSCSSREGKPPNKMLPWDTVQYLLDYLRNFGKVGILGAAGDRAEIDATENEYYTGLELNKVALMLRDCKFLVTIDNGIAHLAATQQTPTVLFYPACLSPLWIMPIGNRNLKALQVDPAQLLIPSMLWGVNSSIHTLKEEGKIK